MDRGAWQAIVHGVSKSRTRLSSFHFPFKGRFHFKKRLPARTKMEMKWLKKKNNLCKSILSPAIIMRYIFSTPKIALSFFSDWSNNICLLLKFNLILKKKVKITQNPPHWENQILWQSFYAHTPRPKPMNSFPSPQGLRKVASWIQWGVRRNVLWFFSLL